MNPPPKPPALILTVLCHDVDQYYFELYDVDAAERVMVSEAMYPTGADAQAAAKDVAARLCLNRWPGDPILTPEQVEALEVVPWQFEAPTEPLEPEPDQPVIVMVMPANDDVTAFHLIVFSHDGKVLLASPEEWPKAAEALPAAERLAGFLGLPVLGWDEDEDDDEAET